MLPAVVLTSVISVFVILLVAITVRSFGSQSSNENRSPFLKKLSIGLMDRFYHNKTNTAVQFPVMRDVSVTEKGASGQCHDGRLYMQLRIFDIDNSRSVLEIKRCIIDTLIRACLSCAVYENVNSSHSIAILSWNVNPDNFKRVDKVLGDLGDLGFTTRHGATLTGRTYSNRHEKDIIDTLYRKPIRNILQPDKKYTVWYPMRRKGSFYLLPPEEQCSHLLEHAAIGRHFGSLGLASDIRLKCFGLHNDDNEFVIGILGNSLYGPSRVIEEMRTTKQTSLYIDSLGPFFIGRKIFSQGCSTCNVEDLDNLDDDQICRWNEPPQGDL